MGKHLVFDCEANGLLDTVTAVHCICGKVLYSNSIWDKFSLHSDNLNTKSISKIFTKDSVLIGHNILRYDIPLIKMFYGIDLLELVGIENIRDTYIISKLLWPDRPMPKGCPLAITNPVTHKAKKIGPHGLEAWGYRVGYKKIEIHDWREFNEEIIERCEGDVIINEKVYIELLKEAKLPEDY